MPIAPAATRKHVRVDGPGDPDCPDCRGGGSTEVTYSAEEVRKKPYLIFEAVRDCRCVRERDVVAQLDKAWRGLSKVTPVAKSPLASYLGKDLWVRTSLADLRAHLGRVLRDHPALLRQARVVSDADLLAAEFSWKKKKDGDEDDDLDSSRPVDLYGPPKLLVLLLGCAEKKDWALPGIVLTAVRDRGSKLAPTWVIDSADHPLQVGHLTYSDGLERELEQMTKVSLEAGTVREVEQHAVACPSVKEVSAPPAVTATYAEPAATPMHPRVRTGFGAIGIENPASQEGGKGGGGEAPCPAPGCGGTLTAFLGQDGGVIVTCSGSKCLSRHKLKSGKKSCYMRLSNFVIALAKAEQPEVVPDDDDDVDEVIASTIAKASAGGKAVQAAIAAIRRELAQGPRPAAMVEANLAAEGIAAATYRRARKLLGVMAKDRMITLPGSSLPALGQPIDDDVDNLISYLK